MSIDTPCESTPARSVSTITSAAVRASSRSMPHASNTATIWLRRRSALQ